MGRRRQSFECGFTLLKDRRPIGLVFDKPPGPKDVFLVNDVQVLIEMLSDALEQMEPDATKGE